ncbi:hypothetical protein [Massilia horti]|uniref:Uncharacterized protein n=1 Tax=Massilia horti TaxID=2562153 RepID=A0A4Y9T7J0_9BURK|nr:hypothetical protein [Massilia horti]TFW34621.1 hypothetical protein E4O92_03415 [Massilia horti]
MARTDNIIDVGEALELSSVGPLCGRPYPIQFRHQGATDAWARALGHTAIWTRWAEPNATCWEIRLTNSDIDLSLPMSMVGPPYAAQYLRFGDTAMRYLKVPNSTAPDRFFDGVFCFYTPQSDRCATGPTSWTLELIFISKRQDRYGGYVTLLGETDRGNTTVGSWLDRVLDVVGGQPEDDYRQPMHTAVGYVVKVFLYMALKQARIIERHDYDEAMRRVAGLGERKRVRLLQRAASLYNGILVGPEALASAEVNHGSGAGVAPHWRRGHFRMQPVGPGRQERKLIFVAPVLINAERFNGEAPAPKPYRAHATVPVTG